MGADRFDEVGQMHRHSAPGAMWQGMRQSFNDR
jgi:hypothetical protein